MAPSETPWLTQPNLFLLSQSGVAQVWKCKRTISEALLMKRNDFEYVDDVENHLDLIKPTLTQWDKDGYKKLVKYITERRLLVNGQGLVIAELPRFNPADGKMDESVSPLFMWSLDIIALDEYMEHYTVRPIPFRPIQYLEDKNGPARDVQEVELSPNELKLTAELEKENNDKKALDKEVAGLNIKKNGLVDQVAKLKKDLEAKTKEANAAQQELDGFKSQLEGKVTDLEAKNRDLEGKIRQLNAQLADLRRRIAECYNAQVEDPPVVVVPPVIDPPDGRPKVDPSWMTDNWVDIYGLKKISYDKGGTFEVTRAGTRYGDDNTTNVGREYFHGVRYFGVPDSAWPDGYMPLMVVAGLGDRITQARFNPKVWGMFENGGTWYPMRTTDGIPTDYSNAVAGGAPWPPT